MVAREWTRAGGERRQGPGSAAARHRLQHLHIGHDWCTKARGRPCGVHTSECRGLQTPLLLHSLFPLHPRRHLLPFRSLDGRCAAVGDDARYGTRLLLLEREAAAAPAALPTALLQHAATFVQLCPSLLARCPLSCLRQLLQPRTTLRALLLGGESFPLSLINGVRHPDCPTRIYDVYGVTEVSCWATVAEVRYGATTVAVGEPIDGTVIRVNPDTRRLEIGGERRRCFVDGVLEGEWTDSGDRVETVEGGGEGGGWRIAGREGDEVKLHGVRVNLSHAARQLGQLDGLRDLRFAKFLVHRVNFLVLFVQGETVSRQEADSVVPPGLAVHHIERVEEVPLNSSGKADSRALLKLLERSNAADEKTLEEVLKRLGICPSSLNDDCTLAEAGLDSAGMLRLAYALSSELCTRLILAGDCKLRQLREALRAGVEGGGDCPSTSNELRWPERVTVRLEESGDQRSKIRWSQPMEKCVDAAALIVRRPSGYLAIIGSHSGLVVCVEERRDEEGGGGIADAAAAATATLSWSTRVSHRVETAAVIVGREGGGGEEIVAVCSYDGIVSCFDVASGDEWWRYDCGASVRGVPVAVEGDVYIGDYDGRLHRIDITKRRRVWCTQVVGGAMRAPPVVEGRTAATVSIQGATSVVDTVGNGRDSVASRGQEAADIRIGAVPETDWVPHGTTTGYGRRRWTHRSEECGDGRGDSIDIDRRASVHDASTGGTSSDHCDSIRRREVVQYAGAYR